MPRLPAALALILAGSLAWAAAPGPVVSPQMTGYATTAQLAAVQAQLAGLVTPQQAAALAPVQSVNSAIGAVTVPIYQRQASSALDATGGLVSWTFPAVFGSVPTCYESLVATNAAYSFDAPIVTAISKAAVTVKVTAHPSSLSITSVINLPLALPLTVNPPGGTTITLTCSAPA